MVSLAESPTWLLILSAMMGLLNCFFGYKLLKGWVSLAGFLIGAVVGYLIVSGFVNNLAYALLAGVVLGLVVGALAFRFYQAGVFLLALFWVSSLTIRIPSDSQTMQMVILIGGLVISVIAAVLAVKLLKPAVIVITSISGAFSASTDFFQAIGQTQISLILIAGLILAIAGFAVQFSTTQKMDTKKK